MSNTNDKKSMDTIRDLLFGNDVQKINQSLQKNQESLQKAVEKINILIENNESKNSKSFKEIQESLNNIDKKFSTEIQSLKNFLLMELSKLNQEIKSDFVTKESLSEMFMTMSQTFQSQSQGNQKTFSKKKVAS